MAKPVTDRMLAEPPPEGFEAAAALIHAAANTKKNGKRYKRERVSMKKVKLWLMGESTLTENQRVLLDAARRNARLRLRFSQLRNEIRNPAILWRSEQN